MVPHLCRVTDSTVSHFYHILSVLFSSIFKHRLLLDSWNILIVPSKLFRILTNEAIGLLLVLPKKLQSVILSLKLVTALEYSGADKHESAGPRP